MNFDFTLYLSIFALIYVYSRLAIYYLPVFLSFFLNENSRLDCSIEKPRLLFHFIGLSFMHLMFHYHFTHSTSNILTQIIIAFVIFLGLFFCFTTWSQNFKSSFQPISNTKTNRVSNNFLLSISDADLNNLYRNMVRYDLLDQEKTSIEDYNNVLLNDWDSHLSKIHLKMDGPSCREFYNIFIETFPKNSMTLKNFFISSGKIRRPDGKCYNYNTIKNAHTRNPVSKHHEVLLDIFSSLK